MITRRQGGSDAGILFGMSRKLTTKPTQFAFECDFVSVAAEKQPHSMQAKSLKESTAEKYQ